jgi:hypothetical protein
LKRQRRKRTLGLMESLYLPMAYPREIQDALRKLPPLATEIANRWMRGWPKATKEHLRTGDFLMLLKDQEEQEREAYSQPGNGHLARHEIAELYGLSPKPPKPALPEEREQEATSATT